MFFSAFRAFAQRNSISSKTLRSLTYLYLTHFLTLSRSLARYLVLSRVHSLARFCPTKVISLSYAINAPQHPWRASLSVIYFIISFLEHVYVTDLDFLFDV